MKELSDQARAAIFFACAIVIFLVWSHFFLPATPTPSQLAQKSTSQQSNTVSQTNANAAVSPTPATTTKPTPALQATAEASTAVETPVYRVQLSNRGGVVKSWQLKKYFDNQAEQQPLDLINADSAKELGWPFSLSLQDSNLEAEANSALYQITPTAAAVQAPAQVTMQWSDGHLSVTKKLTFSKDYDTDVEASVLLDGKPIPFALAWRGQFGDRAVYQAPQLVTVFYSEAGKLNTLQYRKLGVSGNQIQPANQGGPMEFAGIEDQFFAAAFIPKDTGVSLWHWTQWHHFPDNNSQAVAPDPEAQIAVGPTYPGTLDAELFVGPKDLQILGQQSPSLEGLINFGWTGVIAKPLLFALEYLHKYIRNYGWVIVVFTLALNTILFPVKMWSFKSARKMQLVAPEIKAIQDRYKKYSLRDPRKQKMNEEVMAVYQREGINPASGCLPMIPQLIILWAFWRVLAYSIVLRHEPWIGWIHDLSARDPYYVLPIGMAVTAYMMQKLTPMPATVDPGQQRMMMLMPLFFVVLLFRYASGLNLYYFTANLVGAAQQWYLTRSQPLPSRSKFKKKRE